jgi:hypothetical protein
MSFSLTPFFILCKENIGLKTMKRLYSTSLIFCLAIFFAESISAQSISKRPVFSIIHNAGVTDLTAYESALRDAPLFEFMKVNAPSEIVFDNGIRVTLLSLNELKAMGSKFEIEEFNTVTDLRNYVFYLNRDGSLGWRKTGSAPK